MYHPQFEFVRRYNRERKSDESKLIGVDGYVPPTADRVERLSVADLKSHLARSNRLLVQMAEAYLDMVRESQNSRLRDYDEITKLREHYRSVCQHEWSAEWRETNHAFRKCCWCHKIDKRAGGGAWVGD